MIDATSDPADDNPASDAHERADRAGHDGYIDPSTGLFVMTRNYLVRRGTCCGNDCRHCPYC